MTLLSDRFGAPTAINLNLPDLANEEPLVSTPLPESHCHQSNSPAENLLPSIAGPARDHAATRAVASPGFDFVPANPLDAVVGANINPTPIDPHQSSTTGNLREPRAPQLRLPSFELLGLANTAASQEPDSCQPFLDSPDELVSRTGSASLSCPRKPGSADGIIESPPCESFSATTTPSRPGSGRLVQPRHYVTTITPPDESGRIFWQDMVQLATPDEVIQQGSTSPVAVPHAPDGPSMPLESSQNPVITVPLPTPQPRIKIQRTESDRIAMTSNTWLHDAADIIIKNLETANDLHGFIRVLSHALPCPSKKGFAFPIILNSLHDQTPGCPTCWINVFHAVPGRYNLSDLPTSPPATPAAPGTGEDYFTSKVFDSAIPILDYQNNVTDTPKRVHPIVPPGTVHVSIVERYIPPTSINEFAEMFDVRGHSLLVDRLVEISPDNGTLLFIYPTREGGETFLKQYLAPILDPLLRSMCVVNNLSVDLGSSLARMDAVAKMLSFDELHDKLEQLCIELGQPGSNMERLQERPAKFTLMHSTKSCVRLDRDVWAQNWWVKQEKPRVREVVSKYFRKAHRLPADSEIMPTSLIHEVLDGVASRGYGDSNQPSGGVEVGVFVIKRSA